MTNTEALPIQLQQESLRLGYFLGRVDEHPYTRPDLPYRGIDRLPLLPTFEELDDLRRLGRSALADVWDRYWDAKDSGLLSADRAVATNVQQRFLAEGISFEVIYAELAGIPTDFSSYSRGTQWAEALTSTLAFRQDIHVRLGQRPTDISLLGFDVSIPVPSFHSAIVQPGLHRTWPQLDQRLNAAGLFTDQDAALCGMSLANEMDYGPLPFCVLEIWHV